MNLPRDKAIEAMDAINEAGYTAIVEAAVIPNHSTEVLYRVSVGGLSHDSVALRELIGLAEGIGLECVFSLQCVRFWPKDEAVKLRKRKRIGAA